MRLVEETMINGPSDSAKILNDCLIFFTGFDEILVEKIFYFVPAAANLMRIFARKQIKVYTLIATNLEDIEANLTDSYRLVDAELDYRNVVVGTC